MNKNKKMFLLGMAVPISLLSITAIMSCSQMGNDMPAKDKTKADELARTASFSVDKKETKLPSSIIIQTEVIWNEKASNPDATIEYSQIRPNNAKGILEFSFTISINGTKSESQTRKIDGFQAQNVDDNVLKNELNKLNEENFKWQANVDINIISEANVLNHIDSFNKTTGIDYLVEEFTKKSNSISFTIIITKDGNSLTTNLKTVTNPTQSKGDVNKTEFNLTETVEKNAYKITKEWIITHKDKLLWNHEAINNASDIITVNAEPKSDNEQIMVVTFTIKANKSYNESGQLVNEQKEYTVNITNFDRPERSVKTLAELLKNYLSPKVTPKKFGMQTTEYIRTNFNPKNSVNKTLELLNKYWKKTNSSIDFRWDDHNYIWSYGGVKDLYLEKNNGIEINDLSSYLENLLKKYNYITEKSSIVTLWFYWNISKKQMDEKTNKDILVYKWTISPLGWGFKLNVEGGTNNGIDLNGGYPISSDTISQNMIDNNSFDVQFKSQNGGTEGEVETIDFKPDWVDY